jgi:Ca-activated chloride channel homolog
MRRRRAPERNRARRSRVQRRILSTIFPFIAGLMGVAVTSSAGVGTSDQQDVQGPLTPRLLPAESRQPPVNLRLDVPVILVPVTVTDALERPLTTLPRESFRVLEDGVEQKITSFSQEDGPVSLGLLFDSSGSMKNRIATSLAALQNLFRTMIPGDEFFLVRFSDRAELLTGFTEAPDEIYGKLGLVQAQGWTAMLDAIAMGAHKMKSARNPRKVLLILSDGEDNNSRFSEPEIKNMVIEADLRVYAIGLFHLPRFLQQLAEETGGRILISKGLKDLPEIVKRLSLEIRSHYVLGFVSSNSQKDGKYRRLKVEVAHPDGSPPPRATWRRGYYAPGD